MAYTPLKSVKEWLEALLEAVQSIRVLGAVRWILADLRVSVVNSPAVTVSSGSVAITSGSVAITSGTVTTVWTVSTVTTVWTVSTVTNQAQLGTYLTNNLVQSQTNTNAVLSNIQNISITP